MRYNAFFGELPLNAFKPRPGGGMTLEGGGNPISAVTNAIEDAVNVVVDPIKDSWVDLRDAAETAAVIGGNYVLPGSSLITSKLVSEGSQEQLNSDLGRLANLAAGGTGAYQGNLANYGNIGNAMSGGGEAVSGVDLGGAGGSPASWGSGNAAFTGELPAGYAGYTAPEVTTLGNVAGTTEGMSSGTGLASMGSQGLQTTGGLGLTAPASLGATESLASGVGSLVPAEYLATAAAPAAGSSLASMLPYMAGGQIATGLLQANAAQKAADVQSAAAQGATQLQGQMFNTINQQQAPYRTAGYQALNQIGGLGSGEYVKYDAAGNPIGTGTGSDYLTHQFNAADLAAGLAPNYDFMLQQGQMANQRAANMGGGALGGNALQGLNKYTQDYAGNAYQNAFGNYQTQRNNIYNTLAGIAGIGQTGQNATNAAGTNATNAASQLGVGSAAAQAAGLTGSTNALANTAGNVANTYLLSSLLNQRGSVTG